MLPTSSSRSEGSREVRRSLEEAARERVQRLAARPHLIARRLRELDAEWDIERALEANAATLALSGASLAVFRDRRWGLVPMVVAGFLLQHALQGWCPPLPVLRRLGFRTRAEIDQERYALKAVRGDFDALAPERRARAEDAWKATR
jgi:hypothetical protein